MATSGSVDFNQTRNEIIQDALSLIGIYGVGRTVSSEDMSYCARTLNRMIKAWQAKGLHLWSKEEGVLFVADNVGEYTLGNGSSNARACLWSDAVITELNGAHSASDTALTVDDTTNMAASDIVGIVLDDDSVDWTTISSVDSSTQITVASGLSSAAADNNNVYTFTSRINKPLRIHDVRRVTGVSTRTEIPLTNVSHQEFQEISLKTNNGLPSQWHYDPDLTTGKLSLWPRPDDPEMYFRFTFERMIEDFDASTDNPDLPSEWLETIVYQLAYRLAPAFGVDKNIVQPEASVMLENMLSWDSEISSVQLVPDME